MLHGEDNIFNRHVWNWRKKSHNNLRGRMSSIRNYLVEMISFISHVYFACAITPSWRWVLNGARRSDGRWTLLFANPIGVLAMHIIHVFRTFFLSRKMNRTRNKQRVFAATAAAAVVVVIGTATAPSILFSLVELLLWFCANSLGILLEINHCLCRVCVCVCVFVAPRHATNEWMSLCALVVV